MKEYWRIDSGFCEQHNILDSAQEGFRPRRSTVRYLYKLTSMLSEAKLKKLNAIILFIDFEKAFDSVWIKGLVIKLLHYGIKGKFLRLITMYLSNRCINLQVNDYIGINRVCDMIGLPQGSILSPLLFIIFVADLLDSQVLTSSTARWTRVFKFADDGTVSVIHKDKKKCAKIMQKVCDSLNSWCVKWRMVINCAKEKTEAIILKNGTADDSTKVCNLKIGNNRIEYVKKTRVLGLVLDENLEYNMHATSTLQNCWYSWLQISWQGGRKWGLNTSSLLILFKTIILTKLFYASPIWLSNNLDKFRKFWSSALLRISGAQYHPQKDLAELGLQLPSLDLQLQIIIVKFVLKCLRASDDCSATILQLQENHRHPFYFHTLLTKKYLGRIKEK